MLGKFFRSLWFGLGFGKKIKKYVNSDEKKILEDIPEGEIFIGLTSDRTPSFLQGGIQGATNSFWQHAFVGKKNDKNEVEIIESLLQVEKNELEKYLNDDTQMILFFLPITKNESTMIWKKAETQIGKPYDVAEFLGHLLPDDIANTINSPNFFVCSTLCVFATFGFYEIIRRNINPQKAAPGDIYNGLYPQKKVKTIKYNF